MEFTINGLIWQIKYVQPRSKKLIRSNGTYTVGMTDRNTQTIYLSDGICGRFLEHVLTHELCHAVCMSYDIYLPIDTEEWLCNFVADHGRNIIFILDNLLSVIYKDCEVLNG